MSKEEKEKFNVIVRVRPLSKHDKELGGVDSVSVIEGNIISINPPGANDDYLRVNRVREKQFAFDSVFDYRADQEQVFKASTLSLLDDVLDGYNATVFAYGPTGSGKTFTMLGTNEQPGVMVLTLKALFDSVIRQENQIQTKVTISYLEVYNENIKDLLSPSSENLDLREDPLKGISVTGIKEYTVTSADEVMQLLQKGNKNRATEPTKANETSSRSHAVCQVHVERKDRLANIRASIKIGKLSLIDLAGSERATNTENRGIRLMEGANINKSLLALANCINALGDKKKKGAHVPYRDSKLTRLLKDSLGGKCRTCMIACISPSSVSFEEITNTLKYANRAKNIQVKPTSNIKNVSYHIKEYQSIINDLRNEIFELRQQMGKSNGNEISKEKGQYDSLREQKQFMEIEKHLIDGFNDKMQLRRTMIEIEDANVVAKSEIDKKQEEIQRWEIEYPLKDKASDESIRNIISEIKIMEENMKENSSKKEQILVMIQSLEENSRKIREDLPRRITKQDRRDLIELLIQSQNLELQNMELEMQLQIRDKIIEDQFRILKEHGLQNLITYDTYGMQIMNQINVADETPTITTNTTGRKMSNASPTKFGHRRAISTNNTLNIPESYKENGKLSPRMEATRSAQDRPSPQNKPISNVAYGSVSFLSTTGFGRVGSLPDIPSKLSRSDEDSAIDESDGTDSLRDQRLPSIPSISAKKKRKKSKKKKSVLVPKSESTFSVDDLGNKGDLRIGNSKKSTEGYPIYATNSSTSRQVEVKGIIRKN